MMKITLSPLNWTEISRGPSEMYRAEMYGAEIYGFEMYLLAEAGRLRGVLVQ
jgi:hypothetical protein